MHELALKAVSAAIGPEHAVDSKPCLASEDFAVWGEEIPSFFYWVGSGTPGEKCAPWHDPEFKVDPHYMETAVPVLCASVLFV
jgi:metal-dependent amidase/aminoacylase/carboxypeptidase family protein